MWKTLFALVVTACLPHAALSQSESAKAVTVTVDNFVRAETDNYIAINAKEAGIGKFGHRRGPAPIDSQTVIRLNRDTLYSFGAFDLAAATVTITLPDAGKRFMSMQVVNEDHYVPLVAYDSRPHTLTEKGVGSRYAAALIRT
jgi:hypothetical protein